MSASNNRVEGIVDDEIEVKVLQSSMSGKDLIGNYSEKSEDYNSEIKSPSEMDIHQMKSKTLQPPTPRLERWDSRLPEESTVKSDPQLLKELSESAYFDDEKNKL
ncbi:hypothetical protein cand_011160 [Cryptosporidium andersoni]|uniref:Uncharacterized protein n=1 Tax=Cryptosporidium andersoni TaxID=117008 RepID=A0A1J4MQ94_9CRYT|nr:hypothetical protein cand_011160 [Cryptosporidium andersoni]